MWPVKRWSPQALFATRRRRFVAGGAAVVAAIVVFVGAALVTRLLMSEPERGHLDRTLDDVTQPTTAGQPTTAAPVPVANSRIPEGPCWSVYGRTAARTSDGADLGHGKPIRRLWTVQIGMMEFPPAFCDGTLYVNNQHGTTWAINAINRHVVWKRKTAKMFDSTPAVTPARVIIGTYDPGSVKALDRRTGRTLWTLKTGGAVEASPVVVNGVVYATSKDHRIYAIDEATGRVKWAFRTAGEIKDSPSVANGLVYFANYAAEVYALDVRTGKVRWRKTFAGLRGDRIYSSVPVRGSTAWFATVRGDIYALNARTGSTRWHSSIPGYVYSTPAISGNHLYIGNYPGKLHAFNARTGRQLWSHDVGGSISGSPTVIGSLVYVSSLSATRTVAYSTKTGAKIWSIEEGRYVAGIGTDRALYLSLGSQLSRWATTHTSDVVRAVHAPTGAAPAVPSAGG
jgi:outer membrane protein assembly factor BamB